VEKSEMTTWKTWA